ncbi:hypothetical protein [Kribbella sp. NPDC049227]|uniref:hypothetical protein n=1 Tax=Kribbella sp. NPDC049227 TaxID=3364113 RepID=UPI00371E56C3
MVTAAQRPDRSVPDVAAAAVRQIPAGAVLHGELVILGADGRLSFDALQQRLVTSPAKARAKAAQVRLPTRRSIRWRPGEWICAPSPGPSAGSDSSSSHALECRRGN